jgi:hypothetical protein
MTRDYLGVINGPGGRKERRGEEEQNMVHVYVQRHHNKCTKTLFEKEEKREEGRGI